MALMALDHARDFFHFGALHGIDPLDLATTTPALFFTRWVTHFCAPVFILLAGTGTFLAAASGRSPRDLSWFLLTRGAWLIVLELTFVQWAGWTFTVDLRVHFALVLWAIGWSMITLAGLIHLPLRLTAAFGLILIVGHHACDGLKAESLGPWAPLWQVLHEGGEVSLPGEHKLLAGYPLVPWIGVMAAGYALGSWLQLEPASRRRRLALTGVAAILAFLALRASNLYGDPQPWSAQANPGRTIFSFLSCHKYPPSLCYLLMTLGPALLLLAWWDRGTPSWLQPLRLFGRVPMFFYLLHLPLLHGLAVGVAWLFGFTSQRAPNHVGFGLLAVYTAWLASLLLLYPLCHKFAAFKRRHHAPWLSYL